MLPDIELKLLRDRLEKGMNVKIRPKKIEAIHVNSASHWQPPLYIKVGEKCANLEKDSLPENIIAIFESITFLVCTPDRGIDNNLPYFFAKEDVTQVVEYQSD